MLKDLYGHLRSTHIVMGCVCVAAFWAVALAKKGSRLHVRLGYVYVVSLGVVLTTSAFASLAVIYDPHLKVPDRPLSEIADGVRLGQLSLLWATLLTGVSCVQGLRALAFRKQASPALLDPYGALRATHAFCVASAVALAAANLVASNYIIAAILAIMVSAAIWNFRAVQTFGRDKKDFYFEHLRGMLLSGVFVQAIFAMVTLTRYVYAYGLMGIAAVWVLPFGVGMLGIRLSMGYFRRTMQGAGKAATSGLHSG